MKKNSNETDKDQNESNDTGISKSGAADNTIDIKDDTTESSEDKSNINVKKMASNKENIYISSTENKKLNFKCKHCDFYCPSKVTINKHTNTRHAVKVPNKECEATECNLKCSLCEHKFKSLAEFRSHIKKHLDEIEGMDIPSLSNEYDLFECNLCSFESGNEDSVREHLIDHVNQSTEDLDTNLADEQKPRRRLIVEYDDDGNYIGDDPRFMDSESESETEDED